MGSSGADLDRIETQRSTDMSHDEEKGTCSDEVQLVAQNTPRSDNYSIQSREGGAAPPMADTEPLPEFPFNLRSSEIFATPGEYIRMTPKIFSGISYGSRKCLEHFPTNETLISRLKSKEGDSVLHLAAAWGHLKLVKDFASEFPCLLLLPNSSGKTPLHLAAYGGHTSVVEVFIALVTHALDRLCTEERKRELNPYVLKDKDGNTALHYAIEGYHGETALCLVEANKDAAFLGNNKQISSLYMAVQTGSVSLVKGILKITDNQDLRWKKSYLDSKLQGKKYLVHAALDAKNLDVLDVILKEYPTLVNERDSEGRTCLSYGAFIGYYEGVCNLLVRSTNGVYVCDQDGSFPIHTAAKKSETNIVKEIIRHCPDSKHLLNNYGQNVLHVAATNGAHWYKNWWMKNKEMEHLCAGQDVDGNTPLHLAVKTWNYDSIPWLATSRMILELQNKNGLRAWEIAKLEMKPNYIYKERWTLALLLYIAHSKGCIYANSLTRPAEPVDPKNNRDYVNSLLVVAALVATVTFAAGFTIPGGFNSSGPHLGRATLATSRTLWVFLLLNILAMQSSVATIGILIWAQLGDPAHIRSSVRVAMPLLLFSLLCMPLAFLFGVITAVGHVYWLLFIICIISGVFFLLAIFVFGPHVMLQRSYIPPNYAGHFLVTFMKFKDMLENSYMNWIIFFLSFFISYCLPWQKLYRVENSRFFGP